MPLVLRSATLLTSSWPCRQCSHSSDSSRIKKCCSSCRALRDGLAPLSAKGGGMSTSRAAASDVELVDNDATCHNVNGPPNNASPHRDGSPTKSRGGTKRKTPPRRLGGMVLHSLPPRMPPALQSTRIITPPAPPLECRGIYHVGFFGQVLTFAAK